MKKIQTKNGTLQEGLASPEVRAMVVEEIVPPITKVATTDENVVAKKREYLASIPDHMKDLIFRVCDIQMATPEEQAIRAKDLEGLKKEIGVHLGYKEDLLQSAAKHAYVSAVIATLTQAPYKDRIMKAIDGNGGLPGFLGLGKFTELTEKPGRGDTITVKIFGRIFRINGGQASKIAHDLKPIVAQAERNEAKILEARATTSINELFGGKPGLVFVNIPDEFIPAPNSKDGKRFLGGGVLLVKSDGKVIRVMEFVGNFCSIMAKIADVGIFMPTWKIEARFVERPSGMDDEMFYLYKTFHNILRRGMVKIREERQAAKNEKRAINSIPDAAVIEATKNAPAAEPVMLH